MIVINFLLLQRDFLAQRIDSEDLGLSDFDITLLQNAEAPADIPRLALAHHDEKKGRHENMIGPPVDENHVVIRAQLSAQLGGGDHPAATAAQDHNPLSSVNVRHGVADLPLAKPGGSVCSPRPRLISDEPLRRFLFLAETSTRPDCEPFQVSQTLIAPHRLLGLSFQCQLFAESGRGS